MRDDETDYDSFEVAAPKPKRTYGRRQPVLSVRPRSAATLDSPPSQERGRSSSLRASSEAQSITGKRERALGEDADQDGDAESASDEPDIADELLRASKRARHSLRPPLSSSPPAGARHALSASVSSISRRPIVIQPSQSATLPKPRRRRRSSSISLGTTATDTQKAIRARSKGWTGRAKPSGIQSDSMAGKSDTDPGPSRKRFKVLADVEKPVLAAATEPLAVPSQHAHSTTLTVARPLSVNEATALPPSPSVIMESPSLLPSVLGDKSNLPRSLPSTRPQPPASPPQQASRTRSAAFSSHPSITVTSPHQRRHFSTGILGGRSASVSSVGGSPRVAVYHDPAESHTGSERTINLATLSSALPSVPAPVVLGRLNLATRSPSPVLVPRAQFGVQQSQTQQSQNHPLYHPVPVRSPLSISAFDLDDDELEHVYRPPHPRSGSVIPQNEQDMDSSMVVEDDAEMELTGLVSGEGTEHGLSDRETDDGEEPFAPDLLVVPEVFAGTLPNTKSSSSVIPKSLFQQHSQRHKPVCQPGKAIPAVKPAPFVGGEDLELPRRRRPPPPDPPLPNGPPSSEDDLAYAIRTTSTGEGDCSSDDDATMRQAEAEIGEGIAPGRTLEVGRDGKKRGWLAWRLRRQVVPKDMAPVLGADVSDDELMIGVQGARG